MVARLVAAGVVVVALAACSPGATSTTVQAPADTPAAALRVHVDLLIGEHVFAVAKLSVAASVGATGEFQSYAGMLAQNEADLTSLMHTALGETAGAQFGDAWHEQNNRIVDYIVASATHDPTAAAKAATALTASYVPQMSSLLASSIGMPADEATSVLSAYLAALRSVVDDAVTPAFAKLYSDIAAAHAQAGTFGDALSKQIVHQFPDRYPGDPSAGAVDGRVQLNAGLQIQAYVMTMATDAAVAGSNDNLAAAVSALAANVTAVPPPPVVWTDEATLVVAYAKTGDATIRQKVLDRAATPESLKTAFTATLQVIDDQRAKAYDKLATDDHTAATAFATYADESARR